MTKVEKVSLPATSLLHSRVQGNDFLDCYCVDSDRSVRDAAEILLSFPGWVRGLLSLRNKIVAPLGLSTDGPEAAEKLGMFPVESESENELIAGFNDRHLNFRVSVLAHGGRVHLATWVHPHNLGGRLYLGAIMPFHILIVRDALRRLGDT